MNKLKLIKRHTLTCSLILILFLNFCSFQNSSVLTEQDRKYFQNVYVDIGNSLNEGNRNPYLDKYSKKTIYMVPNQELISGITAIKKYVYEVPEIRGEFKAVEIWGNSDMANVRGVYRITDPQGNLFDKGKFIDLWQKDGEGNWKVTHEIWNSDLALNAN